MYKNLQIWIINKPLLFITPSITQHNSYRQVFDEIDAIFQQLNKNGMTNLERFKITLFL